MKNLLTFLFLLVFSTSYGQDSTPIKLDIGYMATGYVDHDNNYSPIINETHRVDMTMILRKEVISINDKAQSRYSVIKRIDIVKEGDRIGGQFLCTDEENRECIIIMSQTKETSFVAVWYPKANRYYRYYVANQ